MKQFVLGLLAAFVTIAGVTAQDSPFSQPRYNRNPSDSATASLADIMQLVQMRHMKLWFAAEAGNWDLVEYEGRKIQEQFYSAGAFYHNIPVDDIVRAEQPLKGILESAQQRNAENFKSAFGELTYGCNSCHAAGQVGFIQIQTPTASPFNNQRFGTN